MGTADRYEDLVPLICAYNQCNVPAKHRGAHPNIYNNIQNCTPNDAHELCLLEWRDLEM